MLRGSSGSWKWKVFLAKNMKTKATSKNAIGKLEVWKQQKSTLYTQV